MGGSAKVGVIGGSGFYEIEGLTDVEEVRVSTPFGDPSDAIVVGTLAGVRTAFLPRHGVGHRILPSEVPAQANIYALKMLGVEFVIAVSAVGSLREGIAPLDMVVPDQIIDRTRGRPSTFFGRGLVAHIAFDVPFCPQLAATLAEAAAAVGATVHRRATYVVIEGPSFSTRAESKLYQTWGGDIIGMTGLPEAKLAREAEMHYATLACVTDYDTWHETEEAVTADLILQNLRRNVETAKLVVARAVGRLPAVDGCPCGSALASALVTDPRLIPAQTREVLAPLIGRYLEEGAEA